ncbi:hypothetical protein MTQ01_11715 [Streptomyces sp. XM4193]|uniref:hypothetical protein n=1 Tax=Streptomyces sp. XM4193 TaxID=2929782 RepID=UPI001FF86DD5|nr:hypothetical protein [Streptomyces sp. XM4193]MCK1796670.1 hypothetical protein [Streptomyces sp. XM4193]
MSDVNLPTGPKDAPREGAPASGAETEDAARAPSAGPDADTGATRAGGPASPEAVRADLAALVAELSDTVRAHLESLGRLR